MSLTLTKWKEAISELSEWKLTPEARANFFALFSMLEIPPQNFDVDTSTDDITVRWWREGQLVSFSILFSGNIHVMASDLRGESNEYTRGRDVGLKEATTIIANISGRELARGNICTVDALCEAIEKIIVLKTLEEV